MSGRQVVSVPCKVNLHLGIHHRVDARGYHRVDSVMVPVALCDTLVLEDAPALEVAHEPALEVAPERTTVWRAATMLAEALGKKPLVKISVTARIPEKAGLGGSSADAGATLRALAARWGVPADDPRVVGVARRVGADVAFFLDPRPALYVGAGDVFDQAFSPFEAPVALVMPPTDGVSTKAAYDEFDRSGSDPADPAVTCEALDHGDAGVMAAALANNLAPAAKALLPEVAAVESWLRAQPGVLGAMVTGSGACSFALCASPEAAQAIADAAASRHGWRAWATHTMGERGLAELALGYAQQIC